MPTALKRYQVTEVPELEAALVIAKAVWPEEDSNARLISSLALVGAKHLAEERDSAQIATQAQAAALAGRCPAVLPPDYLEDLRQEWAL